MKNPNNNEEMHVSNKQESVIGKNFIFFIPKMSKPTRNSHIAIKNEDNPIPLVIRVSDTFAPKLPAMLLT